MSRLADFKAKGTEAVRQLRLQELAAGNPFFLGNHATVGNQFYAEQPDGKVFLMEGNWESRSMKVLKVLTASETAELFPFFEPQLVVA